MGNRRKGGKNYLFNMLVFSFTVFFFLSVSSVFIVGCLDATGKDEKLENNYRNRINKRTIVTSENFQNKPLKTSEIKDMLLENVKLKKVWDSAFDAMQIDEEISDELLKTEILSNKSHLRLAAMSTISKMGHQSFEILLNTAKQAKNENELEHILDAIVSALMKNKPDESVRVKLSAFLSELVQKNSGAFHEKALKIWVEVVSEKDYVFLAKYLETEDAITRMLIYRKLRQTTETKVLIEIALHLGSSNMSTRVYAVNLLRQLTGKYFGYNPCGELLSRQITTLRWQMFINKNNKHRNSVSR